MTSFFHGFFSLDHHVLRALFIVFPCHPLVNLIYVQFVFGIPTLLSGNLSSLSDCWKQRSVRHVFHAWLIIAFELEVSSFRLCCLMPGLCFFLSDQHLICTDHYYASATLLTATVWRSAYLPPRLFNHNKVVLWPACEGGARCNFHKRMCDRCGSLQKRGDVVAASQVMLRWKRDSPQKGCAQEWWSRDRNLRDRDQNLT